MILMRRDTLGRYGVRIKNNNVEDTCARAGALLSCLEWLDKECGLLLAHGALQVPALP